MTEKTDMPAARRDGWKFLGAAILAPFAANLFLAVTLIPLAALGGAVLGPDGAEPAAFVLMAVLFSFFFGAIPYVVIGLPAFATALRLGASHWSHFALAGFVANLLILPLGMIYGGLSQDNVPILFLAGFGALFAPAWGGAFGRCVLN